MPKKLDLTGMKFGSLTVLGPAPRELWKTPSAHWYCLCDCGKECVRAANRLTSGQVKSCGCARMEWGMKLSRMSEGITQLPYGAYFGHFKRNGIEYRTKVYPKKEEASHERIRMMEEYDREHTASNGNWE